MHRRRGGGTRSADTRDTRPPDCALQARICTGATDWRPPRSAKPSCTPPALCAIRSREGKECCVALKVRASGVGIERFLGHYCTRRPPSFSSVPFTAPFLQLLLPQRVAYGAVMQLQRTLPAAPNTTRGRGMLLSGHGDTLVWSNAKNVLLFNVKTRQTETFNEHTAACTAARFTAGGDHVASGDASGCVRVWSVATKKCVAQVAALSGAVNDVLLTRDLKTLYACGEGRGRLAGAFNAENGNLLGNLTGLTRPGNSLDVSEDGLRVATGDDAGGCFAHDASAPFKQRYCTQDQGGRAVNCVRFAPGSSAYCSVGGSKALLYTGDGVPPTVLAGHTGSVYCVSFAPGGGQLVTVRAAPAPLSLRLRCRPAGRDDSARATQAGADKTVRLYDTNSAREVSCFAAGAALDDTQVGCYWLAADTIASVALNGDLLLFDQRMAACHTRVIAHQRSVTAMTAHSAASEELWTADYSGRVLRWNTGASPPWRARANGAYGTARC